MPIKFRCQYCRQLLGISRKKIGQSVDCPTCGRSVLVPAEDGDARTAPPPVMPSNDPRTAANLQELASLERAPTSSVRFDQNPNLALPSAGREAMWVPPEPIPAAPQLPAERVPSVERVPISSLPTTHRGAKSGFELPEDDDLGPPVPLLDASPYSDSPNQGAGAWDNVMNAAPDIAKMRQAQKRQQLLALVMAAVVGGGGLVFGLAGGYFLGRGTAPPPPPDITAEPLPAFKGKLVYMDDHGNDDTADDGATVVVLPSTRKGTMKLPTVGLKPGDSDDDFKIAQATVRAMGGDLARADQFGVYKIYIKSGEHLEFLMLSAHQKAGDNEGTDAKLTTLVEMYFADRAREELTGTRAYKIVHQVFDSSSDKKTVSIPPKKFDKPGS